jgi:hypothetical protein
MARGGITIYGIGPGNRTLLFKAPQGQPLQVGEYDLKPFDGLRPHDPSPYVSFEDGCSGRLVVWEIEEVRVGPGGPRMPPRNLAVDFVLYRKSDRPGGGEVPSVSGMLRLNSNFE